MEPAMTAGDYLFAGIILGVLVPCLYWLALAAFPV